jgi:adenylate cyclase
VSERAQRQLSAILAADVAGYSRLIGLDEEGTLARLKELRRTLIDMKINEHRGRIVKTMGDGLLVSPPSLLLMWLATVGSWSRMKLERLIASELAARTS